jgi:O-acetyl-ADP-ribose deacetylase (regulator of RNase III)
MFQNALAELQLSEAYAIMADTGARLCALTQCTTEIAECPQARYFQDAATEIQNFTKDTHLSIEEAMLLLESFEREAKKKADITTDDALTRRLLNCLLPWCRPSVTFHWHVPYILET